MKSKDEIKEAIAKVKKEAVASNYMLVSLSYDSKLILPYKDGLAMLAALEKAESLKERYSEPTKVLPIDKDMHTFKALSHAEYINLKVATLLNINVSELQEAV